MSNPFDVADLAVPALSGIVHALCDRGNQTEAQRQAKADVTMGLILSFAPRDVVEMTLAGQAVLFNELLADGARDALGGMVTEAKQRCHSTLVGMGRLVQGHLDRLDKRGNQPLRAELTAVEEDDVPASVPAVEIQKEVRAGPVEPVASGSVPLPVAAVTLPLQSATADQPDTGGGMPNGKPAAEASWLDEPFEQWVVETPAEAALRAKHVSEPETVLKAMEREIAAAVRSAAASRGAEPALPRQAEGYSTARTLADAAIALAG